LNQFIQAYSSLFRDIKSALNQKLMKGLVSQITKLDKNQKGTCKYHINEESDLKIRPQV